MSGITRYWRCWLALGKLLVLGGALRRQEAEGRRFTPRVVEVQKVLLTRGFTPLLNKSNQIFNLVGVLNPCSLRSHQRSEIRIPFSLLPPALCLSSIIASGNCAKAQSITLDGTLGPAQTLTGPDYVIPQTAGQTVGNNLFHSFGQFNLNTNEAAIFESAANIQNILSRVTGGTPSLIDGLIGTSSAGVNLFLINPQGIIFGPNAQLNIGGATRGSFIATTLDAIVFPNGGQFSATNPRGADSLLRIVGDPSGFLASQHPAAPINSIGNILQVNQGQTLTLLGGEVNLDSSELLAPGGRVELGGVGGAGNLGLVGSGNELRLEFPDSLARNDVSVANSFVSVQAQDKGSIAINAQNLDIFGGSALVAGIGEDLGTVSSQAGDITLNATQVVKVRESSRISNFVDFNATGNSGNLIVTSKSLFVTDRSRLQTNIFGQGNAGNIIINARDSISLSGESAFISRLEEGGKGKSGDIRITTNFLSLSNGGQLIASTRGKGDAGSVDINANDTVWFDGVSSNGFNSVATSTVGEKAVGNSGSINITTGSLLLTNGAGLGNTTFGQGNVGSVNINARNTVSFDGTSNDGATSGILSNVRTEATGNGGSINITTGSLSVTNGAQIRARTLGQGNAGNVNIVARDTVSFDGLSNGFSSAVISSVSQSGVGNGGDINITAGSLSVTNGAQLQSVTNGQGNAGSININTRDRVLFDGISSDGFPGAAFSSVLSGAIGDGGNINITTGSLAVSNGAQVNAGSLGQGNAGSIIINARDRVSIDGISPDGLDSSSVSSRLEQTGIGKGGDIRVTTGDLFVTNGGKLTAATSGQGDAGNIIIDARDRVSFDGRSSDGYFGSNAFSSVGETGIGKGGDIQISANSLLVTNGAQLSAATSGQGDAGSIIIDARDRVSFDGRSSDGYFGSDAFSSVAETGIGKGGDIRISANSLIVTNGAQLTAATSGQGDAGNIIIEAPNTVFLQGTRNGFSSLIATSTSSEQGQGGKITIGTADFRVANGAFVDARTMSSKRAGSITINANTFEATNGGQLITSTESSGQAGNITLNVTGNTTFSGSDPTYTERLAKFSDRVGNITAASGVFANTNSKADGNSGNIVVNSKTLNVQDTARIAVNSQGTGEGGNIDIKADNITLKNQAIISAETFSSQGGNINLGLKDILLLRQGSQISTNAGTAQQGGNGGNITINAPSGFIAAVPTENSDITANAFSGSGGQVTINATNIFGIAPLSRQELERLRPNDLDPRQLITSDITAISQTSPNLSGTITINTLDVEPNRGLVNLPAAPLDNQVSQVCQPRSAQNQSSFIITGRGGLPPNPRTEPLSSDAVQVDWVDLKPMDENPTNTNVSTQPNSATPAPIVEAQGWMRNFKGEVVLTADASTATPRNSWQIAAQCSTTQSTIK
nr:filamentous hemagglutinin N-terminal domain-containing protein [Nostoc sp. ChiSLP01]